MFHLMNCDTYFRHFLGAFTSNMKNMFRHLLLGLLTRQNLFIFLVLSFVFFSELCCASKIKWLMMAGTLIYDSQNLDSQVTLERKVVQLKRATFLELKFKLLQLLKYTIRHSPKPHIYLNELRTAAYLKRIPKKCNYSCLQSFLFTNECVVEWDRFCKDSKYFVLMAEWFTCKLLVCQWRLFALNSEGCQK